MHIPKAAGTSICHALYGKDPWHYSLRELRVIAPNKYRRYPKVAFVRHPVDRIVSTYKYAQKHVVDYPNTSVAFVARASGLNDFVENLLTPNLVKQHYFFWTQSHYLSLSIDFLGKFESLHDDFERMCSKFDLELELPAKNISQKAQLEPLSAKALNNIYRLYRDDFNSFGY